MEWASQMMRGVGIVVALVLVNAFFVAAEYALVRVRRTRMEALAAQGSSLARVVLHGLNRLNRYIAGAQVGITLAGLASGRFGEPALAALFDPLLARIFPPALIGAEASAALATGFTLLVITYVLVVLSELVPKAIALQYTDQVTLLVAKPMQLAVRMFTPLVWSMNALGHGVLRLLRLPPPDAGDGVYSGRGVTIAHGSSWIPGAYRPCKQLKHLLLNCFFQGCCISRTLEETYRNNRLRQI